MILLFSVDDNWNIGYKGDLLYKISEDLKRFRRLTEGNIVIMGRKTFESLPNQKALPNRINIVITENKEYKGCKTDSLYIANSIEEAISLVKELNPNNKIENFVIGGGNIARQIMPYCTKAYITKILKSFEKADTSMPNLDLLDNWKIVRESEIYKQEDVEYKYVDYIKLK